MGIVFLCLAGPTPIAIMTYSRNNNNKNNSHSIIVHYRHHLPDVANHTAGLGGQFCIKEDIVTNLRHNKQLTGASELRLSLTKLFSV